MRLFKKLMVLLCAILMVIGFACQNESKVSRNPKAELQSLAITPQEAARSPVAPDGIIKNTEPQIAKDEELVVSGYAEKKKDFNTEDYSPIVENKFLLATGNPLSTFSIDVDEAAYSNVRRYLKYGSIPPVDVSGSMNDEDKLPLVKSSLNMLIDQLRNDDKVSIVVYAGSAGLVLPPTSGINKTAIKEAINNLNAGGSTAGAQGIKLAYETARRGFIKEGNNRVILATDGDFNVGVSSDDELVKLIEKERESGICLSVLGYGMGNYKDNKMQLLADKGNGNHSYIDNINEARKVLVNEFGSTLFTIAKDVKLQIEFNPAKVQAYRLIGYENRVMAAEDFNDDKKDAGELGSGHTVTALYEIIPVGITSDFIKNVDSLKYQSNNRVVVSNSSEIMTIKLRYKKPGEDNSKLITHPVIDSHVALANTSDNFRFSAAVASFGMLLRNSEFKQQSSYQRVIALAKSSKGADKNGYRAEFIGLAQAASSMIAKK